MSSEEEINAIKGHVFTELAASDGRSGPKRRLQKRLENIVNRSYQYGRLAKEYYNSREGQITWQSMKDFKVCGGADYTQDDWDDLIFFPDRELVKVFREATGSPYQVKLRGYPITDLKQIGIKQSDQLVAIQARIIALGDREPDPYSVVYKCEDCGSQAYPNPRTGAAPNRCSGSECNGRHFIAEIDIDKTVDQQAIKLHDSGLSISAIAKSDDLIYKVKPGVRVYLIGILNFEPYTDSKTKKQKFRKYIDVIHIEPLENSDIELSTDDINRIKSMPLDPTFWAKLRSSFAPHLYDMEEVKEACILALGSQGIERPLNILLCGDPDTGKSECMEYAVAISHNGHKTDMASSTSVGLTVESFYDEDTKTRLEGPGLLNMGDRGLVGIDEFNAIKPEDAKKLNRALESKEINSDKAGVHTQLPARCALVVTSNSYYGKWDENYNVIDNLKFLGSATPMIVSRFDLIYILKDKANADRDAKRADKIIKSNSKKEKPTELFLEDTEEIFGINTLRKYFAYITQHVPLPELPDELHEQIIGAWLDARKNDNHGMVGNRYLKSVIRLARVIARIMQRTYVTMEDCKRAKELIDKSRDSTAFDPKTQSIDANITHGVKPDSQVKKEAKIDAFWDAYETAKATYGVGYVTTEQWVDVLVKAKDWTESEARKYIADADRNAKIYGVGQWRRSDRLA